MKSEKIGLSKMQFTNEEYADIVLMYGEARCSSSEARRLYQERFPNRRLPHVRVFSRTFMRLRETGSVLQRPCPRERGVAREGEQEVLDLLEENPSTSVRRIARQRNMPKSRVHRILKQNNKYPFHLTKVQALLAGDPQQRLSFCRLILQKDREDSEFLKKILWTDESNFPRDGSLNLHNTHHWENAANNPHKTLQTAHQHKFSFNVWAGVIGKVFLIFCV